MHAPEVAQTLGWRPRKMPPHEIQILRLVRQIRKHALPRIGGHRATLAGLRRSAYLAVRAFRICRYRLATPAVCAARVTLPSWRARSWWTYRRSNSSTTRWRASPRGSASACSRKSADPVDGGGGLVSPLSLYS